MVYGKRGLVEACNSFSCLDNAMCCAWLNKRGFTCPNVLSEHTLVQSSKYGYWTVEYSLVPRPHPLSRGEGSGTLQAGLVQNSGKRIRIVPLLRVE